MSKENETKKSKYLRDSSTPKIKHMRSEDEPISKYIRRSEKKKSDDVDDEFEESNKQEYRKSVMTPKRAKELMLEEEQKAKLAEEEETDADIISPEEAEDVENKHEFQKSKGSSTDIFRETEIDEEQKKSYRKEEADKTNKEARKNAVIRMVLCILVLIAAAVFLQLRPIYNIKYMPRLLTTEFSAFPELIAAIAYGPIFGVAVCIIKDIIAVLVDQKHFMTYLSNMLLNSSFVFIAGMLYSKSMFSGDRRIKSTGKPKHYRRKRIFISSFIGAIISTVPQFLITRFIAYPLIAKVNNLKLSDLLVYYQDSYQMVIDHVPQNVADILPPMNNLSYGILIYNIPLTLVKLFIITVITSLIYKYISPFLHYRKKSKKVNKPKPKSK